MRGLIQLLIALTVAYLIYYHYQSVVDIFMQVTKLLADFTIKTIKEIIG